MYDAEYEDNLERLEILRTTLERAEPRTAYDYTWRDRLSEWAQEGSFWRQITLMIVIFLDGFYRYGKMMIAGIVWAAILFTWVALGHRNMGPVASMGLCAIASFFFLLPVLHYIACFFEGVMENVLGTWTAGREDARIETQEELGLLITFWGCVLFVLVPIAAIVIVVAAGTFR